MYSISSSRLAVNNSGVIHRLSTHTAPFNGSWTSPSPGTGPAKDMSTLFVRASSTICLRRAFKTATTVFSGKIDAIVVCCGTKCLRPHCCQAPLFAACQSSRQMSDLSASTGTGSQSQDGPCCPLQELSCCRRMPPVGLVFFFLGGGGRGGGCTPLPPPQTQPLPPLFIFPFSLFFVHFLIFSFFKKIDFSYFFNSFSFFLFFLFFCFRFFHFFRFLSFLFSFFVFLVFFKKKELFFHFLHFFHFFVFSSLFHFFIFSIFSIFFIFSFFAFFVFFD